ncbi:MAG: hypothetical protein GC164_11105 [Phycisphaera sp.]|nr:hypothetical protein [Phycisphaera sp.]
MPTFNRTFVALIALALLALVGCSSITVDAPVGQAITDEQAKDFEGLWRSGEPAVAVKHIAGGRFVAATLDYDEKASRFKLQQFDCVITDVNGRTVIHLAELKEKSQDDKKEGAEAGQVKPGRYSLAFGTLTDDGSILLWPTNYDTFEKAVESGALKGTVVKDNGTRIQLTDEPEKIAAFIASKSPAELYDLDRKPTVLVRIDAGLKK